LKAEGGAVLVVLGGFKFFLFCFYLYFQFGFAFGVFGEFHGLGFVCFLDAVEAGVEFGNGGSGDGDGGGVVGYGERGCACAAKDAAKFSNKAGHEVGVFDVDMGAVLGACPMSAGVVGITARVIDPAAGIAYSAVEQA